MCLHLSMEVEDFLSILMPSVICRPLCNIGMHLITLLNILLMPRYQKARSNAKCHEVTLMVKSLVIIVTYHTPQNRVIDTIIHVTLNTINNIVPTPRQMHQTIYGTQCHMCNSVTYPTFTHMLGYSNDPTTSPLMSPRDTWRFTCTY